MLLKFRLKIDFPEMKDCILIENFVFVILFHSYKEIILKVRHSQNGIFD